MADVSIIGDGPGGLSAALFLAKNGLEVTVFAQDDTAMHAALLSNYLGIPRISGTEFQKVARKQVASFGATIEESNVVSAEKVGDDFTVTTETGGSTVSRYLIDASGPKAAFARDLGAEKGESSFVAIDINCRSSVDKLYVVGWAARPGKSQAVISAGDGAAAALDILSTEEGRDFHDFDVPEEA